MKFIGASVEPHIKRGLELYAYERGYRQISDLVRVAVYAFIRRRKPSPEAPSYEYLKDILD